jgi:steroid 5-alpha reductase family enzyme
MRSRDPARFAVRSLYTIFLTQGVLIWVISLPLQVAAGRHQEVGVVTVAGLVVFAVGLAFEAIGDEQLRAFKADPANRGQVMDRGLWRYTRHPNYFGDACVWWGLWLASGVWWTVFAPLVMSFLLIRVSGKGLLERDIAERRPGYAEYIRRTSGFVPLPPRR